MRFSHIGFAFCFSFISLNIATADEVKLQLGNEIIGGPKDPADHDAWLKKMKAWREEARKRIQYNDEQYQRPQLKWAQRAYVQPQAMVEDRYFYDVEAGKYTV